VVIQVIGYFRNFYQKQNETTTKTEGKNSFNGRQSSQICHWSKHRTSVCFLIWLSVVFYSIVAPPTSLSDLFVKSCAAHPTNAIINPRIFAKGSLLHGKEPQSDLALFLPQRNRQQ